MTSRRRFYKAIFKIEVLSEEPISDDWDLDDIEYQITEGECSGRKLSTEFSELSSTEVVEALKEQGSDPEFFNLDDEGNDLDDEEDEEDAHY